MILASYGAARRDIRSRPFRPLLWLGIALNLALLTGFHGAFLWLIFAEGAGPRPVLPIIGEVTGVLSLLSPAALAFMALLSPLLMVPVSSAFTALFLDDVATRLESRPGSSLPPWEAFVANVNFFGLLAAANIGLLIAAPVLGGHVVWLFFLANAALLGHEYFMLAALRHLPKRAALRLWARNVLRATGAGLVMMGLLMVPALNLAAPVWAAAAFARLVGRLAPTSG